jgi:putative endonuclease
MRCIARGLKVRITSQPMQALRSLVFGCLFSGLLRGTRDDIEKNFVRNGSFIPLTNMKKRYYIYMLSNTSKMIYTGMTGDLERRVYEHKNKLVDGFTKKYNLHTLVYYDWTDDVGYAIKREKQIKKWSRIKRVKLIESMNPKWEDLAKDWFS